MPNISTNEAMERRIKRRNRTDAIKAMRSEGATLAEIADALSLNVSTVGEIAARHDMPGGAEVRRIRAQDRAAEVLDLRRSGMSWHDISMQVGISAEYAAKIARLARRDASRADRPL
jgi:uncharacterized protein YerC